METIGQIYDKDGLTYVKGGCTANGTVYKDYDAYHNDPTKVCYVPEYGFPDGCGFDAPLDEVTAYTGEAFLNLCYGNKDLADYIFGEVDWQHPDTLIDELEEIEYDLWSVFWDFVEIGADVECNDPYQGIYGTFKVVSVDGEKSAETKVTIAGADGTEHITDLCLLKKVGD